MQGVCDGAVQCIDGAGCSFAHVSLEFRESIFDRVVMMTLESGFLMRLGTH